MNNGRRVYSAIFRFYEIQQTNQAELSRRSAQQTLNVLPSKKIGVASDLPNQDHDGLAVSAIGYCR
jgi:hypothetical protein